MKNNAFCFCSIRAALGHLTYFSIFTNREHAERKARQAAREKKRAEKEAKKEARKKRKEEALESGEEYKESDDEDEEEEEDVDSMVSDFERGMCLVHNQNAHIHGTTALAGWRDPYVFCH